MNATGVHHDDEPRLPPMARTCPLSVVKLAQYRSGMSASLVHTEPLSLLLVEAGLRSSSTEHEKIILLSSIDKYNCPLQRVRLGAPDSPGKLLTEDHWRVLVSSVSTSDDALPDTSPPATIRWVAVMTAADHIRGVGIGGSSVSHLDLAEKQRRVLVAPATSVPPIVVNRLLTTAMLKHL